MTPLDPEFRDQFGPDFASSLRDPAFQPNSSCHFEEAISHFDNGAEPVFPVQAADMDFSNFMSDQNISQEFTGVLAVPGGARPVRPYGSVPNLGMNHVDPTYTRPDAKQAPGNATGGSRDKISAPTAVQHDTVHGRKSHVRQKQGQVMWPDDGASKRLLESQKGGEENAKREREQRARYAANQRHSKWKASSKKARTAAVDDGDVKDGECVENEDRKAAHRARNREAASKCRTKKKAQYESQEADARQLGAHNRALRIEEQNLRNEKSELLGYLLGHQSGVCDCQDIHAYNIQQAANLVFGATGNPNGLSQMSPSMGSIVSAQTPGSEMSFSMQNSMSDMTSNIEIGGAPSRSRSLSGPLNFTFARVTTPEMMEASIASAPAASGQSSAQFGDFLQESPGAHGGFSYSGGLDSW